MSWISRSYRKSSLGKIVVCSSPFGFSAHSIDLFAAVPEFGCDPRDNVFAAETNRWLPFATYFVLGLTRTCHLYAHHASRFIFFVSFIPGFKFTNSRYWCCHRAPFASCALLNAFADDEIHRIRMLTLCTIAASKVARPVAPASVHV